LEPGDIHRFSCPLTAGQLHAKFPPHLMHLPERFGLFTVIVIGEAVVSVVMGISADRLTFGTGSEGQWTDHRFCTLVGILRRRKRSGNETVDLQESYQGISAMALFTLTADHGHRLHCCWGQASDYANALYDHACSGGLHSQRLCGSLHACSEHDLSSYPGKPPDEAISFVLPLYGLVVLTIATGFLASSLSGIAVVGF
jgi:hypothetical protein